MNKYLNAALNEPGLPDVLMRGLIGICLTAPEDGVHKSPEFWADVYLGERNAFPADGLWRLAERGLLQIGFGRGWYAILKVRMGRLFVPGDSARPGIPVNISRAVWERDGDRCAYCGDTEGPFHLDHIMPWSRGGKHEVENLTVACATCNLSKKDRTPEEWMGGK